MNDLATIPATRNGVAIQSASLLDHYLNLAGAETTAIAANAPEVSLSNFTNLVEGQNRFRLLTEPVYGAEVWFRRQVVNQETAEPVTNDDGSPKMESTVRRYLPGQLLLVPADLRDWHKDKPRKFMGLLVFNYNTNKVEILAVSNGDFFDTLFALLRNKEVNHHYRSDLIITKQKDGGMKNIGGKPVQVYKYLVSQSKENQPGAEVVAAMKALPFLPDLTALFRGEDPLAPPLEAEEVAAADTPALEAGNGETKNGRKK